MTDRECETFEQAIDSIIEECREVVLLRQTKYGSDNIALAGLPGILVRMQDKVRRAWHACGLDAMVRHGDVWEASAATSRPEVNDEDGDDPYIDMVGYGLIALMVRRGIWGLPLEDDVAGGTEQYLETGQRFPVQAAHRPHGGVGR